MGNEMISLVVATRNRSNELLRLIESLERQTYKEFEVIIIDQSGESSIILNNKMILNSKLNIKYITSEIKGLSIARNQGMDHASGEIICFPDDDCWYEETLLERVSEWFTKEKHFDVLSGVYHLPEDEPYDYYPSEVDLLSSFGKYSSVTLFVKRKSVIDLRFDEKLGAGCSLPCGEEIDFVLNLLGSGSRMYFDPSFVIFHIKNKNHKLDISRRADLETANSYVIFRHAIKSSLLMKKFLRGFIKRAISVFYKKDNLIIFTAYIKGALLYIGSTVVK